MFIPAAVIKRRTDADVFTLLQGRSVSALRAVAVFYALYFIYTAEFFLLPYTDMFCKKYYSDAPPCVISFLVLAGCVYAAFKGINVITRFGIFLFAFAMLTNVLIFGGSLSSLNLANNSFSFEGDPADFLKNTAYFITPGFIAVLFACLSSYVNGFRLRQTAVSLLLTGVKFICILFFVCFAVGAYASRQEYQSFVLSRVAHLGSFAGIESFLTGVSTMSVFMITSLVLCCIGKGFGKSKSLPFISFAAAVIFIIHLAAAYNQSVAMFFTAPLLFDSLTLAAAVIAPVGCYWLIRRSSREKT